jgi:ferric-dicitrate binding protein FerR (iron transport regulator)
METGNNTDSIIRDFLEGKATAEELKLLLKWIKESKENIRHFNQVCSIWENSGNVADNQNDTEIALRKLNDRIQIVGKESSLELEDDRSNQFILLRIAAVALVLIGLTIFLYFGLTKRNIKTIESQYVTAIAPKSQKSQLILADGTKVWLNSGTTLKYKMDYGNVDRKIYLEGEAYFEVAKNPSKPFLVYASNIVVKAIGTSFNVKCYLEDNIIETTLVEGKVQVTKSNNNTVNESVYLNPKERAIFNRLDNKLVVTTERKVDKDEKDKDLSTYSYIQPKSIQSVISWKNEELIFENEPFEELTKRLERWYNVKIRVLDVKVNQKNSYTGKFVNNESLEQVLKIVSRTTPIKYTFRNGEILIESKNNP